MLCLSFIFYKLNVTGKILNKRREKPYITNLYNLFLKYPPFPQCLKIKKYGVENNAQCYIRM